MAKLARVLLLVVSLSFFSLGDLWSGQATAPAKPMAKKKMATLLAPADLKWTDVPDVKGVQQAPLWGNPRGVHGVFNKFAAGTEVPLHTHSYDSQGVVISGTMVLTPEGESPKELGPGSYWSTPAGLRHVTRCKPGADCVFYSHWGGAFDVKLVKAPAAKK